ncbi:MAG: hypothetical protein GY701_24760 [Sulfitobacter sp.]|nr:hypothetical protein [Sulfitobacter sp.]
MSVSKADIKSRIAQSASLNEIDNLEQSPKIGKLSLGGENKVVSLSLKRPQITPPIRSNRPSGVEEEEYLDPSARPDAFKARHPDIEAPPREEPQARSLRGGSIRAKVPRPGDYDPLEEETARHAGRALLKALATITLGAAGAVAGLLAGGALGSLAGGPFIGGIVGAGIGAGAGAFAGARWGHKLVDKLYAKGNRARLDTRIKAHNDAREALQSLRDEGKLTQTMANGWSRYSASQMRSLLVIDESKVTDPAAAKKLRKKIIIRAAEERIPKNGSVGEAFKTTMEFKARQERTTAYNIRFRAEASDSWKQFDRQFHDINDAVETYIQQNPPDDLDDEKQAFFREQLTRLCHMKYGHEKSPPNQSNIGRQANKILAQIGTPDDYQEAKDVHGRMAGTTAQLLQKLQDPSANPAQVLSDLKAQAKLGTQITHSDLVFGKGGSPGSREERWAMAEHAREAVASMNDKDAGELYRRLTAAGGVAQAISSASADPGLNLNAAEQFVADKMMTGLEVMLTALAEKGGISTAGPEINELASRNRIRQTGAHHQLVQAFTNKATEYSDEIPIDLKQQLLGENDDTVSVISTGAMADAHREAVDHDKTVD